MFSKLRDGFYKLNIDKDDVRKAFLSHATSKIKSAADLDNIGTLGFRGEALASVAAVSKVELLTRKPKKYLLYCDEDFVDTKFERFLK